MVRVFYEGLFWLGIVLLAVSLVYPEWFAIIFLLALSFMLVTLIVEGIKIRKEKNIVWLIKRHRHRLMHFGILILAVIFAVFMESRNGRLNIRSQFSDFILAPIGITWWLFVLIGFIIGLMFLILLGHLEKRKIDLSKADHEKLKKTLMEIKEHIPKVKVGKKRGIKLPRIKLPRFKFAKIKLPKFPKISLPKFPKLKIRAVSLEIKRPKVILKKRRIKKLKLLRFLKIKFPKFHVPSKKIKMKKMKLKLKFLKIILPRLKLPKLEAKPGLAKKQFKIFIITAIITALITAYLFYRKALLLYAYLLVGIAAGFAALFLYNMLKKVKTKKIVKYKIPEIKLKYGTDMDRLYQLIKQKGEVKVSQVALTFGIKKEVAEEWGKILESHDLIEIKYSAVGELVLCRK